MPCMHARLSQDTEVGTHPYVKILCFVAMLGCTGRFLPHGAVDTPSTPRHPQRSSPSKPQGPEPSNSRSSSHR